jgi:hypothetical protein
MSEIERALAALNSIPSNLPYQEWIKVGIAAIAAGLSIDDLDQWSSSAGNYKNRKDVESAFKSVTPNGAIGPGTLFFIAKEHGFIDTKEKYEKQLVTRLEKQDNQALASSHKTHVVDVWNQCIPATNFEAYINRKNGNPVGLKVYPAKAPKKFIRGFDLTGALVIPCWDGNQLQTLQFITHELSEKLNLPGASFGSGYFAVGDIASANNVYLVEGIGQAWALTNADPESAAVVCFGVGRMMTVAKKLSEQYQEASAGVVK